MPLFSQQLFWACLLVIFGALGCLLRCAVLLSRDAVPARGQRGWAWLPLSLHAGWLSLAAFLNLAQVIVAYDLTPADRQLPWSLALFAIAAAMRSEEHTSELQSLMRISYAVFCLKKKK